ncbi:hypothetical protein AVEN_43687-1 [Araneus ventricosus]|uniref:Uncharacterized protein n=1 Tax=Araneus ventricosus TaxID=182803 RepID=A0A4Y1ZLC6_ARAVE|nr:hypothetical protein AVEN_43687-1 [Araneus ventricosus]
MRKTDENWSDVELHVGYPNGGDIHRSTGRGSYVCVWRRTWGALFAEEIGGVGSRTFMVTSLHTNGMVALHTIPIFPFRSSQDDKLSFKLTCGHLVHAEDAAKLLHFKLCPACYRTLQALDVLILVECLREKDLLRDDVKSSSEENDESDDEDKVYASPQYSPASSVYIPGESEKEDERISY